MGTYIEHNRKVFELGENRYALMVRGEMSNDSDTPRWNIYKIGNETEIKEKMKSFYEDLDGFYSSRLARKVKSSAKELYEKAWKNKKGLDAFAEEFAVKIIYGYVDESKGYWDMNKYVHEGEEILHEKNDLEAFLEMHSESFGGTLKEEYKNGVLGFAIGTYDKKYGKQFINY